MNGDLTRDTFDPARGFTAVRAQQGRVMLDADLNELVDLQLADTRDGRRDIVGPSGAPADEPGFAITVAGGTPQLGAGRFVLDGLRLRNPAPVDLADAQPFLPGETLPDSAGEWLAYLEAWERPLTAVEEPALREVALGGPDTTLRHQLVWQVRWLPLRDQGDGTTCAAAEAALTLFGTGFDGTLQPRLESASASAGPCIVAEAAQFRGLENQLYRIEIHRGNRDADGRPLSDPPTFKWSRDNGSVVASVVDLVSTAPIRLEIDRLGPGGAAGFGRGTTVELLNDVTVLTGSPGLLARVEDVEGDTLRLALLGGATATELSSAIAQRRPILRRWDSDGATGLTTGWLTLEQGLQIQFNQNGRFRTGDFWLVPARTATLPGTDDQLDWPRAGSGFAARPPRGPLRRRTALAVLERDGAGAWTHRRDCRRLFPPLTAVVTLAQAGGDGQHGPSHRWLPAPLAVLVARGNIPAAGVTVRFTAFEAQTTAGLSTAAPDTSPTPRPSVEFATDAAGRAAVFWRLGQGPSERHLGDPWEPNTVQRVDAVCLGPAGTPEGPTVSFFAQVLDHLNLSIAGGNAQHGRPGQRLPIALRVRVDDGHRPVADAVVEFEVLNRTANGSELDQSTGGSLHASSPERVSGERWPGGSADFRVRVATDQGGVAQLQWTLGTLLDLPTQRVEARLIGDSDRRTAQAVLFTAQLAVAPETTWLPRVPWLAAAVGNDPRVQSAIDALARRVEQLSNGSEAFAPFLGAEVRLTNNNRIALTPRTVVHSANFAAISLREDLVPRDRNTSEVFDHGGIRVYIDIPNGAAENGVTITTIQLGLPGNVGRRDDRWEWRLPSETRGELGRASNVTVPIRVQVVARLLPGGLETDSTVLHEIGFRLTIGRADPQRIDDIIVQPVHRRIPPILRIDSLVLRS